MNTSTLVQTAKTKLPLDKILDLANKLSGLLPETAGQIRGMIEAAHRTRQTSILASLTALQGLLACLKHLAEVARDLTSQVISSLDRDLQFLRAEYSKAASSIDRQHLLNAIHATQDRIRSEMEKLRNLIKLLASFALAATTLTATAAVLVATKGRIRVRFG